MRHATSADGTRIGFDTTGSGPDVLLVHGSAGDRRDWLLVAPLLAERFTVHAMDRRGRGASGDAAAYALQREAEDVAAVVAELGGDVAVVGHSLGALVALEAARLAPRPARLVLYEPPFPPEPMDAGLADALDGMVAKGAAEEALALFLREVAGMPDEAIAMMARADPAMWAATVATAPTLGREVRADFGFRFDPSRYAGVSAPTLLLLGSESAPFFEDAARAVAGALPDARIEPLEGQAHGALLMAPDLLAARVAAFLASPA